MSDAAISLSPVERFYVLPLFAAMAWIAVRFPPWLQRRRSGVSLDEYKSAYRAARWFPLELGFVLKAVIVVVIMAAGVAVAFPEWFGGL